MVKGYNQQYYGPEKSYIVEPGRELNYKLADKNPLKFYDQVLNQEVKKTKVRKDKVTLARHEEQHRLREEKAGSPLKKRVKNVPLSITQKSNQKRSVAKVLDKVGCAILTKMQDG